MAARVKLVNDNLFIATQFFIKLKKIETLLDMDLSNPFTKTNLYIAFLIEDVLAHK